ncbi:MAG: hypothetical protein QXE01_01565 [Sulfolobales archaeon]
MWSSAKVLSLTIPVSLILIVASIYLSIWLVIILIPLLIHLIMVLSGYLYYRIRGCPQTSYFGRKYVYAGDKRVDVLGEIVHTSSGKSSTIYLVRGRALPLSFLLNPILLCVFTYFSPIKLADGIYEAYGAMYGSIYVLRSRIGGELRDQDIGDLSKYMEAICYHRVKGLESRGSK